MDKDRKEMMLDLAISLSHDVYNKICNEDLSDEEKNEVIRIAASILSLLSLAKKTK